MGPFQQLQKINAQNGQKKRCEKADPRPPAATLRAACKPLGFTLSHGWKFRPRLACLARLAKFFLEDSQNQLGTAIPIRFLPVTPYTNLDPAFIGSPSIATSRQTALLAARVDDSAHANIIT